MNPGADRTDKENTMSHSSMLKSRRKKQTTKKQLHQAQKQARRDRFAGKATKSTP